MKKRILAPGSAIAAVALVLAGCSSTPSSSAVNGKSGSASGGVRVAFVSQVEGIPYFNGFHAGASKEAAKLGITYTQSGPSTSDATQQVQILNNFVSQGYNAVSISPLDPTSINNAIAKAQAAGTKVITADADAPKSSRSVFVSQATDMALGATVMDELAKAAGNSGQYAIVSGGANVATFNNWIAAAKSEAASKFSNMTLVGGIRYTENTADALTQAQNLMTAFPDLKGIIAVPSFAVPGVAQAVTNAGKIGKVAVTGFGSPQTAGPFLKSGAMTSTVLWNVDDLGALTVWAMDQVVRGKPFETENTVPGLAGQYSYDASTNTLLLGRPSVFTKDNYAKYNF
ncbi:autoinducer 2 ABC transporter substrate-binding protein [Tsukamurella soli]|uniref:Autoinducer 2 ABC transporter substrate-binding protein n=1 Tax=Tsukamurella soli TaxID=644556 RepID=A0ABP8JGM6_9ACTN